MHIVHILRGKANPATLNGVNKVVHSLATAQLRKGHRVEVWGLSPSMTPPPHAHEYPLRLFPITRLRLTLGDELKQAIRGLKPETWVQFHSVFIPEFPAIARLLKARGLVYGITPHSGYSQGVFRKNPWKKGLYLALREAKYVRGAAWAQAIGESEIGDVRRIAPHVRVSLIPNGQEMLAARNAAQRERGGRPLIGYCGRLAKQHKGLDYLIEGFAAYKADGGTGEMWLIGDGPDRAELERLALRAGALPHLRFLGAKFGEEQLDILASFDLFIHSSRWEGLPMACLEAAVLGKPLVVSRETNLASYVESYRAGAVLDETSAAGVRRGLHRAQQLHEDEQLEPMGRNARSMVKREFCWEKIADSFIDAVRAAKSDSKA